MDSYLGVVSGKVTFVMKPTITRTATLFDGREYSTFAQSDAGAGAFYV
jgi:hypothetical protein